MKITAGIGLIILMVASVVYAQEASLEQLSSQLGTFYQQGALCRGN